MIVTISSATKSLHRFVYTFVLMQNGGIELSLTNISSLYLRFQFYFCKIRSVISRELINNITPTSRNKQNCWECIIFSQIKMRILHWSSFFFFLLACADLIRPCQSKRFRIALDTQMYHKQRFKILCLSVTVTKGGH